MNNCQTIVFSSKAYNAIIRESFDKDPVETGGILLGHILDNGIWIVMEVLPPGINSTFEIAYFEYDDQFVNYLAQSVADQYKIPLSLLGLWHRHPGSMDVFSLTDDTTNLSFASLSQNGAISGLVNIDPRFRLTMYHLNAEQLNGSRPKYQIVSYEIGDDLIPDYYFDLKYYNKSTNILNLEPHTKKRNNPVQIDSNNQRRHQKQQNSKASGSNNFINFLKANKRNCALAFLFLVLLICICHQSLNQLSCLSEKISRLYTTAQKRIQQRSEDHSQVPWGIDSNTSQPESGNDTYLFPPIDTSNQANDSSKTTIKND